MVIVDGVPSRAALLVAAARRKTPLRCKQQDGCHLVARLQNIDISMAYMKVEKLIPVPSTGPAACFDRTSHAYCAVQ
jgi:hypothetical protein